MRDVFAKCFVAMGVGLAVMLTQGCKKRAAPATAQPVVLSVPRVQTDFPVGALPFDDADTNVAPRLNRSVRKPQPVQLVQVQGTDDQAAAIAEAAQRQQDAKLLQEQQAASTRQQQELDREVQQNLKMQQEVEEEPRIQEAPEMPLPQMLPVQPGQVAPRIQDTPLPPGQQAPVAPPQPQ
jgi:hypothetical protein